jgi:hypothetical protein
MSGDQAHCLATAVFTIPWDRFFDQGERVFEAVFLALWLAFMVFLICCAAIFLRENANSKTKNKKKRRDRPASPARGLR